MAGKKDTLATWGSDPAKVAKKVWFAPRPAGIKKLATIGLPKRVGLISFYVFDTGSHNYRTMADATRYENWGMVDLTANDFASDFAVSGVPAMKEEFAAHGLELLTPDEFLETPKQVHKYLSFKMPEDGFQKFGKGMREIFDKNPNATGAAHGFSMIPTHLWMNPDILRSLETLRQDLGLDALVVLTNSTSTNKDTSILASVAMQMFGPNPVPKPEHKIAAKYWTPTVQYSAGTFGKGFKGVVFHFWNKENLANQYVGYDGIVRALTARSLDELQEIVDKGK